MKPSIYSIILLFITTICFSQTKEIILKKSFKVDENTTLDLDLDNVAIIFEESFDDKIHFDYSITFINYPKKKKDNLLADVNVKASKKGNVVFLDVKNSMYLGAKSNYLFSLDSLKSAIIYYGKNYRGKENLYKTKEKIAAEIEKSIGNEMEDYLFQNKSKYENIEYQKTIKKTVKKFIMKVPKYVEINIKAIHSSLFFNYNFDEKIIAKTFQGELKFKKITSKENRFELINGFFQAEEINGGTYNLKDVYPTKIGLISNTELNSESSRIQIGEIKENVTINDYSSKLYLFNFNENFTKFNLKGDYSELNFYKVKETNFSMDVFGLNTTLNMNDTKTTFGTSKNDKFTKILEKKRKENIPFLGNIEIQLKNGVLNIK
jgi:hypothetical protein